MMPDRGREGSLDIGHHRVGCQHRGAEIAAGDLFEIDAELRVQRLVQPHLLAHPLHHVFGRAVADNRQHRIDRHHAADEERDREQSQVGQCNDRQETAQRQQRPLHANAAGHCERLAVRFQASTGDAATYFETLYM